MDGGNGSGDSVDAVRWIYGVDWASVGAKRRVFREVEQTLHPEFESLLLDKPGAGALQGMDGMRSFGEAVERDFVRLEYNPALYEVVVPGRVLVSGTIDGRARATGHRLSGAFVHVWTVASGRATRVEGFSDRNTALRMIGPPGGSP